MSLVKSEVAPSAYIDEATAPSKIDGRTVAKKAYRQAVNRHSTIYTLWLIAVKHKVGLLMVGNVILVMNFVLPEWPSMVLGLIGK